MSERRWTMIDTHCHLTFPQLHDRLPEVLSAARGNGVETMICIGTTPDDAVTAREIAHRERGVWFTAGVHPHYAQEVEAGEASRILDLARDPQCVALGEMGLDYHYNDPPRDTQHTLFHAQLDAIRDSGIDKPIVLHCRKAVDDTLEAIRASGLDAHRFVFHCFAESPDEARKVLDSGAMLSFTGIVTYKNAPEVRESAKLVPLDRIMVETDSPYLTPEPHRKVKPNEPRYVRATARFLAELRGVEEQAFLERVDANAGRLFSFSGP